MCAVIACVSCLVQRSRYPRCGCAEQRGPAKGVRQPQIPRAPDAFHVCAVSACVLSTRACHVWSSGRGIIGCAESRGPAKGVRQPQIPRAHEENCRGEAENRLRVLLSFHLRSHRTKCWGTAAARHYACAWSALGSFPWSRAHGGTRLSVRSDPWRSNMKLKCRMGTEGQAVRLNSRR